MNSETKEVKPESVESPRPEEVKTENVESPKPSDMKIENVESSKPAEEVLPPLEAEGKSDMHVDENSAVKTEEAPSTPTNIVASPTEHKPKEEKVQYQFHVI